MNGQTQNANATNCVKIAVLGARKVGKSALTVRHLTRRYIGEYRSNTDLLYRQTLTLDGIQTQVEILDVSMWNPDEGFPFDHTRWADSVILVYDICSKQSFQTARDLLKQQTTSLPVVTLVGTRRDLEHAREVTNDAGRTLAHRHGCAFFEVSAADGSSSTVHLAFQHAVRAARACNEARALRRRKLSLTMVTRALSGFIKVKRPWLSL